MVTITNYQLRENKAGKKFVTLELQGDLEMVQSMETVVSMLLPNAVQLLQLLMKKQLKL